MQIKQIIISYISNRNQSNQPIVVTRISLLQNPLSFCTIKDLIRNPHPFLKLHTGATARCDGTGLASLKMRIEHEEQPLHEKKEKKRKKCWR